MSWKSDIKEWAQKNNRDVSRQEGILISDGWDPQKYIPSMKSAMFDYLDKWHALHIKNMPTPATAKRRNPIDSHHTTPSATATSFCINCGESDNICCSFRTYYSNLHEDPICVYCCYH